MEQAADLLAARFARAGGAVVTLQVPLADVAVAREIVVTFSPHPERSRYQVMNVTWAPKGGGPYPSFAGTLTFEPAAAQTNLALDGNYEPPGGVAGKAFDAIVGRRIAAAGVRALLEAMKVDLEAEYRDERERTAQATRPSYLTTYE
ncbi:MAG: SRPBCC family protein [Vulcanimicrobiaceae bacterium]